MPFIRQTRSRRFEFSLINTAGLDLKSGRLLITFSAPSDVKPREICRGSADAKPVMIFVISHTSRILRFFAFFLVLSVILSAFVFSDCGRLPDKLAAGQLGRGRLPGKGITALPGEAAAKLPRTECRNAGW
ncbi:MAG: hypothetical protein MZV63_71750 [Marinilabiliales bacterium]|nr:hypothetical protein [Marinilabiliales bacterium]